MKGYFFICVATLLFYACDGNQAKSNATSLQNKHFVIKKLEFAGKTLTPSSFQDENSSISFENDSYNGFAGCNNFFGSLGLNGGKVSFLNNGGSTKMMCLPQIMAFEDILLGNLQGEFELYEQNDNFILRSNQLTIYLNKSNDK